MMKINWQGVYPAVTTQYFDVYSINFEITKKMVASLIKEGVDDIALESLMLGCTGWISGLTNVFPQEAVAMYKLAQQGRYQEVLDILRC
jgi:dihydrodipicolinate synthase/N-acetylneuraminate lyase